MSQRRIKQEANQDPDDVFVAKVLDVGNWAQTHQQVLTVAGVVAAIGVFGSIYYMNFRAGHNLEAVQQLEVVHQSVSIRDTEGAKDDLVTFLERYGDTPYEGEARLLLGQLYLEGGDYQQAQAVLGPLGSSPRSPIELQAATLLGVSYEQDGRWVDAEAVYLSIADRSDLDFQVRDALAAAARIRGAQGDADGAIELYERVLGQLEDNSPERGLIEMRIEELRTARG